MGKTILQEILSLFNSHKVFGEYLTMLEYKKVGFIMRIFTPSRDFFDHFFTREQIHSNGFNINWHKKWTEYIKWCCSKDI